MSQNKNVPSLTIKAAYQRHVAIDENIHATLDLYSLSLYMAFRFEADYRSECSSVKRSAQFLYQKAKISRAQFYRCMTILENYGLILREEANEFRSISTYHVARELDFFNTIGSKSNDVPERDNDVSDSDTDQYSLSSSIKNTTSVSDETSSSKISNQEILDAYHEHLPELTRIKTVDRDLANKIKSMQKNWPKYQKDGMKFSIELFIIFINFVRKHHSWFIKPYTTEAGNQRKNSLRNLITEKNLAKFANGEFSAN
jgi:hypothetical protein